MKSSEISSEVAREIHLVPQGIILWFFAGIYSGDLSGVPPEAPPGDFPDVLPRVFPKHFGGSYLPEVSPGVLPEIFHQEIVQVFLHEIFRISPRSDFFTISLKILPGITTGIFPKFP